MKINVYTIFDSASAAYMRPFFAQSDGQATRSFGDIANDKNHEIGKHPEDYSLWRIGTFDDNTAEINPETKACLATALELVALEKANPQSELKLKEVN
jgi:hypothetical protein